MTVNANGKKVQRHDHRRSIWAIAGGAIIWCYRCGAWKLNGGKPWHRPTGLRGENPAITGRM